MIGFHLGRNDHGRLSLAPDILVPIIQLSSSFYYFNLRFTAQSVKSPKAGGEYLQ